MVEFLCLKIADGTGQGVRFHHHVGIGKEQQVAGCLQTALPERMVFAQPAPWQIPKMKNLETRIANLHLIKDVTGRVFGAIVDEDQLQMVIVEGQQRL